MSANNARNKKQRERSGITEEHPDIEERSKRTCNKVVKHKNRRKRNIKETSLPDAWGAAIAGIHPNMNEEWDEIKFITAVHQMSAVDYKPKNSDDALNLHERWTTKKRKRMCEQDTNLYNELERQGFVHWTKASNRRKRKLEDAKGIQTAKQTKIDKPCPHWSKNGACAKGDECESRDNHTEQLRPEDMAKREDGEKWQENFT